MIVAITIVASCGGRQAADMIEMELSHPGEGEIVSATLPVQLCMPGVITAYNESANSWRVHLDEEQGGLQVAVILTSPSGERLQGVLVETVDLSPGFSGSGTADLLPEGDPNAEPSRAQLAWLCS